MAWKNRQYGFQTAEKWTKPVDSGCLVSQKNLNQIFENLSNKRFHQRTLWPHFLVGHIDSKTRIPGQVLGLNH